MAKIVSDEKLSLFVAKIFQAYGLHQKEAEICTSVLVESDLRGIPSHGVARLKRYTDGMDSGLIRADARPEIVQEGPSTATVDGNGGLGQIIGHFATELAILKAQDTGVGVVSVRNSNHYGIAGYYAQMMLKKELLGISMTNSAPLVVPTFGKEMVIGTNPISLAAPTHKQEPFFLDMATSVVPRGKLEVYEREGKDLPEGWAVDESGKTTQDAGKVLQNMLGRTGGGILPLGGEGELFSGYKGYGMAVMVDILSGVLSGGAYANRVYAKKEGKTIPPNVCHFFLALDIERFVDLEVFKQNMDDLILLLKNSEKAKGHNHIFIHGEKEYENYRNHKRNGIPLQEKVYQILESLGEQHNILFDISK
jgi:LDH2 family malate/lactate/ureidoglycolate dehydrogenase